jgi:hypothetical protein
VEPVTEAVLKIDVFTEVRKHWNKNSSKMRQKIKTGARSAHTEILIKNVQTLK